MSQRAAPGRTAANYAFEHWFGLQRLTAAVLLELYRASGAPAKAVALSGATGCGLLALQRYHMPCLRQALDTEAIDYDPVSGYALTDDGMAECRAALWTTGEELRRAS